LKTSINYILTKVNALVFFLLSMAAFSVICGKPKFIWVGFYQNKNVIRSSLQFVIGTWQCFMKKVVGLLKWIYH